MIPQRVARVTNKNMPEKQKELKALVQKRDGKLLAVASTETVDRQGDSLKAKGWILKDFILNPVLLFAHKYQEAPVGVAKNLKVEKDALYFEPVFHEITQLAREVKQMYEEGIMKAFSVGFIPRKRNEKDQHEILEQELLEISAVPVPANAEALMVAAKSLAPKETEKINKWVEEEKGGCPCVDKDIEEDKESGGAPEEEVTEEATTEATPEEPAKEEIPEETEEVEVEKAKEIKEVKKALSVKVEESVPAKKKSEKKKEMKAPVRWNPTLSKLFDVEVEVDSIPATFEYDVFSKFLECPVKNVFINNYTVPSPLLGTYLAGFKSVLSKHTVKDTRNFSYNGGECPPQSEVIRLNSEKTDDFLVEGTVFYEAEGEPVIIKYTPGWSGITISIVTAQKNKKFNKDILTSVHNWVKENNFLKGEKFALNGEFIPKSEESFEDVIVEEDVKKTIKKSVSFLNKKGKELNSRGLLFIGEPGTGKTKTGKALVNEAKATFIWVSSKDFNRIDPISALSLAFKLGRDLAPSILFLEDIDTWLKDYTIDLLKTELDGIRENKGVVTILTSNFPEKLPDALLNRPGRFHDIVEFSLPTKALREEMLTKWAGKLDKELLDSIGRRTEGFSGAYIKELVDFAKMIAEDDEIDMGKALLMSLKKLEKQRTLIGEIKKKEDEKLLETIKQLENDVVDIKEGRVLSGRNRKLIGGAIDTMEKSISALRDLLEATGVEASANPVNDGGRKLQGRKEVVQGLSKHEIAVRALRKLSGDINQTLSKVK